MASPPVWREPADFSRAYARGAVCVRVAVQTTPHKESRVWILSILRVTGRCFCRGRNLHGSDPGPTHSFRSCISLCATPTTFPGESPRDSPTRTRRQAGTSIATRHTRVRDGDRARHIASPSRSTSPTLPPTRPPYRLPPPSTALSCCMMTGSTLSKSSGGLTW